MKWFDEVWTKEVFANHFAAWISEPLYPEVNHRLNRLRSFNTAALSEDRTEGTVSISQEGSAGPGSTRKACRTSRSASPAAGKTA